MVIDAEVYVVAVLCKLSANQLLVSNFNSKAFDIKKNTTIEDNRVINMVFRKVSNKIKALNIYKFSDKIDELRALIVTPADETAAEGEEK